jgi:hypothetical protein
MTVTCEKFQRVFYMPTYVRQPVLKGRFRNCVMIVTISSRMGQPRKSHGYFNEYELGNSSCVK